MADEEHARRMRKERLLEFYRSQSGLGSTEERGMSESDPFDIDGLGFQASPYLNKLLKERSLTDLMDKEKEMIDNIRSLDSEMQTLVYENYNKFITATDTIKMMKTDFKKMEEEMNLLAQNMTEINKFSTEIRSALHPKRDEINKLAGTHHLLRKLQYLFELPQRLRVCVSSKRYMDAVQYYKKAKTVLDRYNDMPSFQGIRDDSHQIMSELKTLLWTNFTESTEIQDLASVVDILRKLDEPPEKLADEFLKRSQLILNAAFDSLRDELHPKSSDGQPQTEHTVQLFPPDILHFANIATETVLDKLSNHISLYNELFLINTTEDKSIDEKLESMLVEYLDNIIPMFLAIINERMEMEKESGDNAMLVRAMDRFHARLQALNKLVPRADFARRGLEMVCSLGAERCRHYLSNLKRHLADCLTDVRQRLASGVGVVGAASYGGGSAYEEGNSSRGALLSDLLQATGSALVDQMKATLNAQQSFIAMDNTFSKKPVFQEQFCVRDVREGIVVAFFRHMTNLCQQLAQDHQTSGSASSAPLLLILSRLCLDWAASGTIEYLITLVDEQFIIDTSLEGRALMVTKASVVVEEFRASGDLLLNAYVRIQGLGVSQMIRKSVETRDWLNTIEPRSVRSVMKRVIEDVTQIDQQVGQLFDSNQRARPDRGSDSSRRGDFNPGSLLPQGGGQGGPGMKSTTGKWSQWSLTPSTLDNTIITNIQKLFAEKIDIFAKVEAFRESILTGVIKIGLKTFMECVRLRTFGKYGLQQIQVDCRYLQIYLWRFVTDEKLVNFLLDEVIGSVLQRCVEPKLMEESIIEAICERS